MDYLTAEAVGKHVQTLVCLERRILCESSIRDCECGMCTSGQNTKLDWMILGNTVILGVAEYRALVFIYMC